MITQIIEWFKDFTGYAFVYLIRIIAAVIIFRVVLFAVKKLTGFINGRMEKRGYDRSFRGFIVSIIKYGTLAFALFTVITKLEIVAASSIAAIIASAGVGISLALQGGLSNFAGGVILLALRPFKDGDYICLKSGGLEGTIDKIEMYYTTIIDEDGNKHLIPNSQLTGNAITNLTPNGKRKIIQSVSVDYSSDIPKVKSIVMNILSSDERIENGSEAVFVDDLSDSAVVIGYRGLVLQKEYKNVCRDLNEKLKITFDAEGIRIPFTQVDIHIKDTADRELSAVPGLQDKLKER